MKVKNKKWFEVKNQTATTAEIYIYGDIGDSFWGEGIAAKPFIDLLNTLREIPNILIHLNSAGGAVFDGIPIYNAILNHPAFVEIRIEGLAASIASVIALAGDKVVIADNAFFMIHDPWAGIMGTAEEMRAIATMLDQLKSSIIDTYVKHSNADAETIANWMAAETWFTAKEALAAGFVDEISTGVKVTASFDLSAFKKLPDALRNELCACKAETAILEDIQNVAAAVDTLDELVPDWRKIVAQRVSTLI